MADPFGDGSEVDARILLEHPALVDVIDRFRSEGIDLHVVGGPVRDLISEGHPGNDLDLTSSADVATMKRLLDDLGAIPDTGQDFGTVKLFREGMPTVEITQWRAESYRDDSRKPETTVADSLEQDLARRDFTLNAMAIDCHTGELIDPYGGRDDLEDGILRTPGDPDRIFSDDPLRTVRLVRFAAIRGWEPDSETLAAAARQADKLDVAAPERRLVELEKVLASPNPEAFPRAIDYADRIGVGNRLFGGFNTMTAANYDLRQVPPSARLAALVYASNGVEAKAALRNMKVDNDTAKHAIHVVNTAIWATSDGMSRQEAREIVRKTPERVIDDARSVVEASGGDWPSQLGVARAQADKWKRPLPVNGNDALAAGKQGREIGGWLARVEQAFLNDPDISRDEALSIR